MSEAGTEAGVPSPAAAGRRSPAAGSPARSAVKRAVDISVAVVGLVATSPIVGFLLVASAVTFRANPMFVQRRIGRGGREIPVPKIRTLPPGSPPDADKRALIGTSVPRLARFMRRTHLDELPQLWSVLVGHMSLVGPRPEMPGLAAHFDPEHARIRTSMRPGITGLWQVSEGVVGLIRDTPEYDLVYVRNWSLRLDAWILWRTLRVYLPGHRPVTMDDVPSWAGGPAGKREMGRLALVPGRPDTDGG